MKKIINPWKKLEGYNCFGCSPDNEYGVKMSIRANAGIMKDENRSKTGKSGAGGKGSRR